MYTDDSEAIVVVSNSLHDKRMETLSIVVILITLIHSVNRSLLTLPTFAYM